MTFDKIETISKSLIQHGSNNDRVYLMKLHPEENIENLIDQLCKLVNIKGYTKLFVKVPESIHQAFLDHNFKLEAIVPNLYLGKEQGCFLGRYFNTKRGFLSKEEKKLVNKVKELAIRSGDLPDNKLTKDYEILQLHEKDIPLIANIYQQVFQYYPFPIFDEKYLLDTMLSNVQYFGVWHKEELIAVSSAEIDVDSSNAEMTDFATLPKYRGKNLSYYLLQDMMSKMVEDGIHTTYTIARATSFGMNKTFARQGFHFGGTLVNNTLIGNTIESMNVWYKNL